MKCIKKSKKIQRVSDIKAIDLVDNYGWKYCPKHEWKAQNEKK